MHATVDIETYSEAGYRWDAERNKWASLPGFAATKRGLGAVGVWPYAEHESFRILLVAYDMHDGVGARQWEMGQAYDVLEPLFAHIRAGGIIEAHNAAFERTCLNRYADLYGWPRVTVEQMRCSAVKSRAAGYPGKLAEVARVLGTPVQKDADGDRLMRIFSMPRNPTKADARTRVQPHEAPEEWKRYKAYNVTDVAAEIDVSIRVPDLPPDEQRYWFIDQKINDRGCAVDLQAVENCISVVEQAYERYGAELRQITGGIEPTELEQLRGWLSGREIHMPDMRAESIEFALSVPHRDPVAMRALTIRQMLSSASVKKLYALRAMTTSDGRVHEMYMMHATHHGRTGGYGPQPANLYKGEWHTPAEVEAALEVLALRSLAAVEAAYPSTDALTVVNNCVRSVFVAAPSHTLVSSDYSAIEGVVLAALAGEQWILDVFHSHGMLYEAQISRMTGIPFDEFVRHKRETGKHHPLRQQGKLAVLSGGYQSWINGWKEFGADEYYGSDEEIKAAILSYRDSVPAIVEFWGGQTRNKFNRAPDGSYEPERQEYYGLEGAAIMAVMNPGECFRVGLIAFQVGADDCLYCQLPSGRFIRYHSPRLRPSGRAYASSWEQELSYSGWNTNPKKGPVNTWLQMDLYGGILTQNCVGGTARDIFMHGLVNAEAAGYSVVLHTYDEATAEVPIGFGSVEGLEAALNDLPAYARGWPIRAKGGWTNTRYGKYD